MSNLLWWYATACTVAVSFSAAVAALWFAVAMALNVAHRLNGAWQEASAIKGSFHWGRVWLSHLELAGWTKEDMRQHLIEAVEEHLGKRVVICEPEVRDTVLSYAMDLEDKIANRKDQL